MHSDPPFDSSRVLLDAEGAKDRSKAPARAAASRAPELIFLGQATLGFLAIVMGLALVSGAPFVAPTESISPALGVNCAVPLGLAVAGYLTAQLVYQRLGGGGRSWWMRRSEIGDDAYLLGLFVVIMFAHFHLKMWMPVIHPHMFDASYLAIDAALGSVVAAADWVRATVIAVLPQADRWYGPGLMAMFALSFWLHAVGRRRWHYHNMTALLLLEMLGPLAYLVAPAVGPFVFAHGPSAHETAAQATMYAGFLQVQSGGAAWLAHHGGDYFTAPPAAMPSLHVAAAWVITYYAVKARSALSPLLALGFAWIVVESVALRWHYLADLPAGFGLACGVIFVANRVCRHRLDAPAARRAAPRAALPIG